MSDGSTALAAISAAGSAVAAIATWIQSTKTARQSKASIYVNMASRYANDEMRVALRILADFASQSTTGISGIVDYYKAKKESDKSHAIDVEDNCRRVAVHFVELARLKELKLIDTDMLKFLASHPGLNIFYDIVPPITAYINPNHNCSDAVKTLKAHIERHGSGFYLPPAIKPAHPQ